MESSGPLLATRHPHSTVGYESTFRVHPTILFTSSRTLSSKSFVVFLGFQPHALSLSALQRELVPRQVP